MFQLAQVSAYTSWGFFVGCKTQPAHHVLHSPNAQRIEGRSQLGCGGPTCQIRQAGFWKKSTRMESTWKLLLYPPPSLWVFPISTLYLKHLKATWVIILKTEEMLHLMQITLVVGPFGGFNHPKWIAGVLVFPLEVGFLKKRPSTASTTNSFVLYVNKSPPILYRLLPPDKALDGLLQQNHWFSA